MNSYNDLDYLFEYGTVESELEFCSKGIGTEDIVKAGTSCAAEYLFSYLIHRIYSIRHDDI